MPHRYNYPSSFYSKTSGKLLKSKAARAAQSEFRRTHTLSGKVRAAKKHPCRVNPRVRKNPGAERKCARIGLHAYKRSNSVGFCCRK